MFIKNGKWEWPIAKKIADYYRKNGLLKTILYVILIILGIKIVIINGAILLLNFVFGLEIELAPILRGIGLVG